MDMMPNMFRERYAVPTQSVEDGIPTQSVGTSAKPITAA